MDTHVNKSGEQNKRAAADSEAPIQGESGQAFTFDDNRPQSIVQRKLQEVILNSPRVKQLKAYREMVNNSVPPKQFNKIQATPVTQFRWVDHPNSNQSHWEGRHEPTERDLRELVARGRVRVDHALNPGLSLGSSSSRPNGLFLAAADGPAGAVGAPFPLPPPAPGQVMPQRERLTSVAWPHDGQRVAHEEERRAERTINGGTARAQAAAYGLPDYPRAAHAHIQPDHAIPIGEDRENPANRHPSTEAANQQHSTREYAQSRIGRQEGIVIASRRLEGPLPGRPGLYAGMEFGTGFLTGADVRTHRDTVPYFTHEPGRYGQEIERFEELQDFGFRALASSLRDSGTLSSDDFPDAMYVPPDRASVRRRRRSRSRSRSRSRDRHRRLSRSRSRSRSPEPASGNRSSRPENRASHAIPQVGAPRASAAAAAGATVRVTSAPPAAPQVAVGTQQTGASAAAAAGATLRATALPTNAPSAAPQVTVGAQQTGASASAAAGATLSATTSAASPAAQAAAAPAVIAPPAVHNLNADQMTAHYLGIIQWAQAQGTFSREFLFVRDQPDLARAVLQIAGMGAGHAQGYVDAMAVQIRLRPGTEHGYVHPDIQNAILRQPGLDNYLLAVIRYMTRG
ncbi:hypothetical protein [Chitinophaga ginsengisoli]|uniref:Uncharacterized protein n=1 Tax=Chitinophaga ginsengisoli TaxID=363837 RepID=A0A2P8FUK4_9BACT|nr:hypothetical protein [Chitinophaga ginsengisoli]PSL25406.1 hypothetical protein CLV42_11388 [Chitinophaga ginsengisoli]